ncbi:4765_t:CDS:2 [Funneliformis mosseae]|uniref:4765_t:CDS:1 n=1 Tax=Funneliformis mosseae TaxID=27381 RepID=A0A9N9H063_FUNMO|nr:4765_t:CDS:2 [Funneliformis mosseae]
MNNNVYHSPEVSESNEEYPSNQRKIIVKDLRWRSSTGYSSSLMIAVQRVYNEYSSNTLSRSLTLLLTPNSSTVSTTGSNTPHTGSTPTIGSNNPNKSPPPTTVPTAHITSSTVFGSINVLRSNTNSIKKASIRNIKQRHKIEETIN